MFIKAVVSIWELVWIQTGGTPSSADALVVTAADIDGYSCLPGNLLGSTCNNITFSLLCNGPELTAAQGGGATNNYRVSLYGQVLYQYNYNCRYDGSGPSPDPYIGEPGVEIRLVPSKNTLNVIGSHTLNVTLQLVNTNTNTTVGWAHAIQWAFNVAGVPTFNVQAPTTFPPIPNIGLFMANAEAYGTTSCNGFQTDNSNGEWLNSDLTPYSSNNDPWFHIYLRRKQGVRGNGRPVRWPDRCELGSKTIRTPWGTL